MDIVTLSYKIYIMHYVCTCLFCISMVREREDVQYKMTDTLVGLFQVKLKS